MAFIHGKGTVFLMNAYNLSSYLNNASVSASVETADVTAFGASSKSYIVGLQDATVSASGMYDGATGAIDDALTAGMAGSNILSVFPDGTAVGNFCRLASAHLTSFDITAPVGDVVATSAEYQVTGGVERGVSLQLITTAISATGNGTSVDNGASSTSTAGALAVGHVHVTANTRSATFVVKIQHSSDNTTFADLVTFTTVGIASTTSQRSEVIAGTTINRYIRAQYTLSAGTGSATIGVAFAR